MEFQNAATPYDDELAQLTGAIARMGGLVESQLLGAVEALRTGDAILAQSVIDDDQRIDDLETNIGELTMQLIASRQLPPDDLRAIVAGIKAAGQLERAGDYAKNMAKRAVTLSRLPGTGDAISTIGRMADLVQGMIANVLDAYVIKDVAKADDVRQRDQEVDQMYTGLYHELLTNMTKDPATVTRCTHLLFVAKNIERVGDLVTNVAELVHFTVLGRYPDDRRPKADRSSYAVVAPNGAGAPSR
jgi:phosphate transport system protein